jgi:O-antigen/teichoic acid export membrane protein
MTGVAGILNSGDAARTVLRGAFGGGALKVANALLALITVGLMTRYMGAASFGIYAFALSLVTLLSIPAQLGLPTLIVRDAARAQASNQWRDLRGLLVRSNQFALTASMVLGLSLILIAMFRPVWVGEERAAAVAVGALYLPVITLGALRSATLRGLGHVVQGQFPDLLVRPVVFAGLIGAVVITQSPLDPARAIGLHVAAASVSFLVGIALLMRIMPPMLRKAEARYQTSTWSKSVVPFSIIAAAPLVTAQIGVIAVAAFRPDADVGVYRAAALASQSAMLPLYVVINALDPAVARAHASGATAELRRAMRLAARVSLAAMLPVTLACFIWNEPIMAILFGVDFADGGILLAVMSLGPLGVAAVGSADSLINMTGREKDAVRVLVLGMLLSLVLALAFTAAFGSLGTASAGVLSSIAIAVALNHVARQHVGVSSSPFARYAT